MMNTHKKHLRAFAMASLLALAGCAADGNGVTAKAIDSMQGKRAATELRLSTAAAEAIAQGKTEEALLRYERIYLNDKKDAEVAVNYAQLLRRTGQAQKAAAVLAPFVMDKKAKDKSGVSPVILNEYAASQIELGKFDRAQDILMRVLGDETARPFHADATNLMAVALDAQGRHKEAESMFRAALEGWNGNPTSVMNNLALCLASQGMFDESLTTLRKALVMAPDKQEIARNIQIVEDLREAVVPTAPTNIKKN